jgi:hypothetical protein
LLAERGLPTRPRRSSGRQSSTDFRRSAQYESRAGVSARDDIRGKPGAEPTTEITLIAMSRCDVSTRHPDRGSVHGIVEDQVDGPQRAGADARSPRDGAGSRARAPSEYSRRIEPELVQRPRRFSLEPGSWSPRTGSRQHPGSYLALPTASLGRFGRLHRLFAPNTEPLYVTHTMTFRFRNSSG